jgi:type VI protein secretion system component Hcp
MTSRLVRVTGAAFVALALAGATVTAQGTGGGSAGNQSVGSLQVDGLGPATPIYGFGLDVINAGSASSGGGGGAGKADFKDIQVVRLSDAASPQLFRYAVSGQHIESVRITLVKGPGSSASSYELRDVVVTGFSNADGVEQVGFSFHEIAMTAGGVTTCWDLAGNVGC